jgi:hypothetical protein
VTERHRDLQKQRYLKRNERKEAENNNNNNDNKINRGRGPRME